MGPASEKGRCVMGSAIGAAIQNRINAQEVHDALVYGIRSMEVCGSAYGASAVHAVQIEEALAVAEWALNRNVAIPRDNYALRLLKLAKKKVAGDLAAVNAAVKSAGSAKQLRLALAV